MCVFFIHLFYFYHTFFVSESIEPTKKISNGTSSKISSKIGKSSSDCHDDCLWKHGNKVAHSVCSDRFNQFVFSMKGLIISFQIFNMELANCSIDFNRNIFLRRALEQILLLLFMTLLSNLKLYSILHFQIRYLQNALGYLYCIFMFLSGLMHGLAIQQEDRERKVVRRFKFEEPTLQQILDLEV